MRSDIEDLLARLEAASEGGRALDKAIGRIAGTYKPPDRGDPFGSSPPYTTSLDSAATLTDGKWWTAGPGKTREDEPLYGAAIYKPVIGEPQLIASGEHDATPALALCIAALKARAAGPPEAGDG